MLTWAGAALLGGCGAAYDLESEEQPTDTDRDIELGSATQAVAACAGDDLLYDFNSFAASLAVAIANELGRWDVTADFEVRNGKLELSTTGQMRCNGGCGNVSALLRLQDDAASQVPNHSPAIFRSKLVTWYQSQSQKLTALVNQMLTVDKGVYRIKSHNGGKYMVVDNGSTSDNARIEQQGTAALAGADQWRVILEGTKHRLKNVRSGKCLALSSDSSAEQVSLVQATCSTSTLQQFTFADVSLGTYAVLTKFGKALNVWNASTANDAAVVQFTWIFTAPNERWYFEPVGTGAHVHPNALATAMYSLTARHSGKAMAVDDGSLADGAAIEQRTYSATDDSFHWYLTPTSQSELHYQLVNRRSGKCLDLSASNSTGRLVQKSCSTSADQRFFFAASGDGYQLLYTPYDSAVEVQYASTSAEAKLVQGNPHWANSKQFKLTPLIAGEPHRLRFSHTTNDAACGEYNFWYDIAQPNGQPLKAPQDNFVQLIFAGGKTTLTGADINPFIAQQVSGNRVAIDPTYGLNEGAATTVGSCSASCTKYSPVSAIGQCCSCNGVNKKYVRSLFNAAMYLCTG